MHSFCGNVMDRVLAAYRKSSKQWSSTLNKLAQGETFFLTGAFLFCPNFIRILTFCFPVLYLSQLCFLFVSQIYYPATKGSKTHHGLMSLFNYLLWNTSSSRTICGLFMVDLFSV